MRNGIGARSIGDAQSFMVADHKPRVVRSGGDHPALRLGQAPRAHGPQDGALPLLVLRRGREKTEDTAFAFRQTFGLRPFRGDHPAVMRDLVAAQDWEFTPQFKPSDWNAKDYKMVLSRAAELLTGRRWGERKKVQALARLTLRSGITHRNGNGMTQRRKGREGRKGSSRLALPGPRDARTI